LTQASGRVTHARHVEQQEPGKRQPLSSKMGVRQEANNLTSAAKFLKNISYWDPHAFCRTVLCENCKRVHYIHYYYYFGLIKGSHLQIPE
jgi:hypothetical protein